MAIWSHTLGSSSVHPMLAYGLNNLGSRFEERGQYDDAEALYQQALTVVEHLLGSNHPLIATCLNNLSSLYIHYSQKQEQAEARTGRSTCDPRAGSL